MVTSTAEPQTTAQPQITTQPQTTTKMDTPVPTTVPPTENPVTVPNPATAAPEPTTTPTTPQNTTSTTSTITTNATTTVGAPIVTTTAGSQMAAIVGGCVGGAVLIIIVVAIVVVVILRRRQQPGSKRNSREDKPQPPDKDFLANVEAAVRGVGTPHDIYENTEMSQSPSQYGNVNETGDVNHHTDPAVGTDGYIQKTHTNIAKSRSSIPVSNAPPPPSAGKTTPKQTDSYVKGRHPKAKEANAADYYNLENQKKGGAVFGVKPKEQKETKKKEDTAGNVTVEERNYENTGSTVTVKENEYYNDGFTSDTADGKGFAHYANVDNTQAASHSSQSYYNLKDKVVPEAHRPDLVEEVVYDEA